MILQSSGSSNFARWRWKNNHLKMYWVFPKMVGFLNNHWVFLLNNDSFWGVKWGYHHFRKPPYTSSFKPIFSKNPKEDAPWSSRWADFTDQFKTASVAGAVGVAQNKGRSTEGWRWINVLTWEVGDLNFEDCFIHFFVFRSVFFWEIVN